MNVVDSCGWLEYWANGPNAGFFAPVLEAKDGTLAVPSICIYEVLRSILSQFTRDQALMKIALMREAAIIALDETLASEAALLAREQKLPMADSIILATARSLNAVLWTQDAHFEHVDGVRYIAKAAL